MTVPLLEGRQIRGPESARLLVDGQPVVNFVGCCYLALQGLPELRQAALQVLDSGQPWSQMLSTVYGASDPVFDNVRRAGAEFFGHEDCVFLPTGYFAGLAGVAGLRKRFDVIFIDAIAHFNLFDAARLADCPVVPFRRGDADALRDAMSRPRPGAGRPLVLTDGVYATSGRVPPLQDYQRLAAAAGGLLFVDESHAYGVVGSGGRGAAAHCSVSDACHAGTAGKGIGAQGALLPRNDETAALVHSLPPVRGAGAGAPVSAAVTAAALRWVAANPQRQQHLHAMSQRLKAGLRTLGLDVIDTPAPITSFRVGRRADMQMLQRALFERSIHVLLSNYIGAGPEGVIRCSTFADHSEADIDLLVSALRALL